MAGEAHEVIPSARRLIKSLRDMGYDFAAAVADLVDNSITAGALLVAIDIEFDADDSWVRIADNGSGMNPEQLREAMRYGSDREYEDDDLGRFGLGLKTASMSQCQRLTVASRSSPDRANIAAYCWDLDHIERTNRWEILPLDRNGLGPAVRTPLAESPGTVVLWERLDRILGMKHPYGEFARKRLSQMCRELEAHLGMVFNRFLVAKVPSKRLKILLNGNEVLPWDPFCRSEPATKKLDQILLPIEYEGATGVVRIDPFVLPHQDDFSSPEAFRKATGPAGWNQQQGFYIYRANRMIQSGGWSRLRKVDEHTKLARIGVSFAPALDEAFKINVAKMRVQVPIAIRDEIERLIGPVTKLAREVYDRKPRAKPSPTGAIGRVAEVTRTPSPGAATAVSAMGRSDGTPKILLTIDEVADLLRRVATPVELSVVEPMIPRLRKAAERGLKE